MADTFGIYNAVGTLILNMRAAATFLLLDTWRMAPAGGGLVSETFQIGLTGNDATLRVNIELLHRITKHVDEFFEDPTSVNSFWLRAYSDGEGAKGALIYAFDAAPVEEAAMTPLLGRGQAVYQISILRDEAWESAAVASTGFTGLDCSGDFDVLDPVGTSLYGSLDGRISSVRMFEAPSSVTLYRAWMGIQPFYGNNIASEITARFNPVWEAESGTAVLGSFVNDATARPAGTSSNCLDVTSVPSTLGRAFRALVSEHVSLAGTEDVYLGEWYILGRIKVDAGTVGVQLRNGVYSSLTSAYTESINDIVYVSNTSWRLIDLGKARFPIYGMRSGYTPSLASNTLSLFIQQISGSTGHFKLDFLTLIPARHFIKAYKTNIDHTNGTYFYFREDGKTDCLFDSEDGRPEATFINWEMPRNGGFFVIAAERESSHDITDTMRMAMTHFNRWRGHRG